MVLNAFKGIKALLSITCLLFPLFYVSL